jgi:uncharacterized protein YcfJ
MRTPGERHGFHNYYKPNSPFDGSCGGLTYRGQLGGSRRHCGSSSKSQGAVAVAQAGTVNPNSSPVPQAQQSPVLTAVTQNDDYRPVVHHAHHRHYAAPRGNSERANTTYEVAQAEPIPRRYAPARVYQQTAPVAQNSPLGIGLGALVGGLVGSRVGGGSGRTIAEIAGAVGGGYVGNEIAKRNQ